MERAARRWLSRGPFVMPECKEDINDWPDFMQDARPAAGRIIINGYADDLDAEIPF